jgi:hypothetical protein
MIRTSLSVAVGLVTILSLSAGSAIAAADSGVLRLHLEGYSGSGKPVLDLDLPWNPDESKSPFDFTGNACGDIRLERLREAWSALQKLPEGQTVTIETRSESIRASRRAGYLVLMPSYRDDRDDHHSRMAIPDYIVNTILDHDGELSNRDVGRLVQERGKITLVKVKSDVGNMMVWIDRSKEGD